MPHRAVIIQSNYVPWKGYFDLLSHADTVVFLDSVQSTKNDWRNRNQIKTPSGKTWLTVPIRHSSSRRIREVEIASSNWHEKHYRTVSQAYARAPYATQLLPIIQEWYREAGSCGTLSEVNRIFIHGVSTLLGMTTRFLDVESLLTDKEHDMLSPTDRLVEICVRIDADAYLSGPAARSYLDESAFDAGAIRVEWFEYDRYPTYPQLHGNFDHAVSILDLLLMVGPAARDYAFRANPSLQPESP